MLLYVWEVSRNVVECCVVESVWLRLCMFVRVYVCAWSAYEGREGNEGCVSTAEVLLKKFLNE